jgi:hypothetical protein
MSATNYTPDEIDVLTEAHKVVPAIVAAQSKDDKRALVIGLQDYAVAHGVLACQVYPIMFAAAVHWLQQAAQEAGRLRGIEMEQVLRAVTCALAASGRRRPAVASAS